MTDIAFSNSSFRIVLVHVSNYESERVAFFRRLKQFMVNSSRLNLMVEWIAILDIKKDTARGARM